MTSISCELYELAGIQHAVMRLKGNGKEVFAESLRARVLRALHACDQLTLDLAGLKKAEPTLLLLVCLAHRTAERLGKKLSISGMEPDSFAWVLEYSGYARTRPCMYHNGRHCLFWKILWDSLGKKKRAGRAEVNLRTVLARRESP